MYQHFILIVALWGTNLSDAGTNKYAEFNDEVSCIHARDKIINDLTTVDCMPVNAESGRFDFCKYKLGKRPTGTIECFPKGKDDYSK